MSSDTAMDKHSGGVADYRASEGKTVHVPYRGPVEETVKDNEIIGNHQLVMHLAWEYLIEKSRVHFTNWSVCPAMAETTTAT